MILNRFLNIVPATVCLLASLCAPNALAQQTKILTADRHNEYGLVYTLPVTALRIDVTAQRTVRTAGPYFQYAKKYIGTDKVIKEDSESWVITDVKIYPYGVPDTENRYLMQLKSGAMTYICVDNDGMLLAINSDATPSPLPSPADDTDLDHVNPREYLQYVNEDFIASQSSAKQAQMLAESLMEIRDAKISLTRGTAETMPTDGKQLELMLQNLAAQERALTGAFIGFTNTQTLHRSYTFTPEEEGTTTLFRFSDFAGFVAADDYSGDPVSLRVSVQSLGELPVDAKGEEKKLPKDAVVYNVPGTATVALSLNSKTLAQLQTEFSQFGIQFGLDPKLFSDKKQRSAAIFNPNTGALVRISDATD